MTDNVPVFFVLSKLSDLILHAIVAEGFSLRFSALVGLRKFRNLKVAATKSLNFS